MEGHLKLRLQLTVPLKSSLDSSKMLLRVSMSIILKTFIRLDSELKTFFQFCFQPMKKKDSELGCCCFKNFKIKEISICNNVLKNINTLFKITVSVISYHSQSKKCNVRFTTVPLKPLSEQNVEHNDVFLG